MHIFLNLRNRNGQRNLVNSGTKTGFSVFISRFFLAVFYVCFFQSGYNIYLHFGSSSFPCYFFISYNAIIVFIIMQLYCTYCTGCKMQLQNLCFPSFKLDRETPNNCNVFLDFLCGQMTLNYLEMATFGMWVVVYLNGDSAD